MKTALSADGKRRCSWAATVPEFIAYHDAEWGFPAADDRRLFEMLCLEGFQSGLSWRTILNKRENFRRAFARFDFNRIARYTARDVARLLRDAGIVRHRGKIEAVVNNARRARELVQREGSLAAFFWRYEPAAGRSARSKTASAIAASLALSRDLKKLGWNFVGATTVYAFMQAVGMVNDHVDGCCIRRKAEVARRKVLRPGATARNHRLTSELPVG
jgi:DNA-3-methyladenine glycosylase I